MTDESEFFKLRKMGKTYISKVFKYNEQSTERLRQVRMVLEGSNSLHLGEIEGALCLRLTGDKRKTQVTAIVSQDESQVRRVTLQTFQSRANDWIAGFEKEEFTFRSDEFARLFSFLRQIEFIDMSNEDNFQIEDISTQDGPKAIIDASDKGIVEQIRAMSEGERQAVIQGLGQTLTSEEINILLGRRQALAEFEKQILSREWNEPDWQNFFERQPWVFGYGLDYRVMRQFDREMMLGGAGTDNKNKPTVDFLETFTDYTVLVEIKRPDTRIFKIGKGGRAGTWEFSAEFTGAVSQILEQKAEWLSFAQTGEHWSKDGSRKLEARTRNARTILIVGSHREFDTLENLRSGQIMRDTFELFRRENRTIDIITFDELLERARFITSDK
ncbi:MAG: Shedu immune nuclease family protein [Cypionkella sp.]|uniref:Shedu immune nuclease family protein n=1 Tax=Cypionkella sp. TaxID=2811411 RepID=UPI002ABA05CD|nr:Shedu immune nuclease family protein [Cypionkella sp.]MDZ4310318.1 Shedu immune nuclease family protein [Cypionkella sp.]